MVPVSGSWSVAMVRMRVDLPAPLGPNSPNMPLGIERETSRSAWMPLAYVLERSRIVNMLTPFGPGEL